MNTMHAMHDLSAASMVNILLQNGILRRPPACLICGFYARERIVSLHDAIEIDGGATCCIWTMLVYIYATAARIIALVGLFLPCLATATA
jgi:hypothetical protein